MQWLRQEADVHTFRVKGTTNVDGMRTFENFDARGVAICGAT